MGNSFTRVTLTVVRWLAYYIPWRTDENSIEAARTNAKAENDELKQLLGTKEKELEALKSDNSDLRTRINKLQQLLHEKENGWETLNKDYNDLRTRLSEMGAMQLTEGNPNITDLSDQNRPDKIAEQFSELYDNQWTDCYMVLMDRLRKSEQEAIETLLTILKTIYDISLNRSQEIMSDARNVLVAFAGKLDEESEKALDSLIQETLHKMKSYRTKHFKAVPKDIVKEINKMLVEAIGEEGVTACSEYIEACVRTCWLMCIKDPPMYIFCEKEDVFNKNHFMEYTEKGHRVSYVVWPVLYLYKNGPLMRKGVAQGEGKQIEGNNVEDGSPKPNAFVENNSQISTGTSEMVQPNADDNAETEGFANNKHYKERRQIGVSQNTSEYIAVQEHGSEQNVGTRDINVTVAEGNSSTESYNKDKDRHLREAVDNLDVTIQFQDDVRSQTANETFVKSSQQGVVEGLGHENSKEGNVAHMGEETESEKSGHNVNGIKTLMIGNNGREESIQQNHETHNQAELSHTKSNIVSQDRDNCRDKESEDRIAVNDQAKEQVESPNTDVTNAILLCKTDDQGSRTTSTEAITERQVEESGKEEDAEINMHLLLLTRDKAVIKEKQEGETELIDADEIETVENEENRDGYIHVENMLMGMQKPANVVPSEEHEYELSNPFGMNSNNSSNNHGNDNTPKVGEKHIVQTSIATGETPEENCGKTGDAIMSIHDHEVELRKETNDVVLLDYETSTVDKARDTDAPHSLDESCEDTEEGISNYKDRPEVNVKEENLGVADVCSLSENNVPGEMDADYNNQNVGVVTADGVANPTVELQKETHHQRKLSGDSSAEGH
ncbi:hypothetical protein ACJMK2_031996 [Sinanodonta woodiana]|uniref:Mitochondria-eating protein n=1 Tax=Sinanodonta woodiana TaxID=1069815 RepID=A0ABD3X0E2_SINWO